MSEQGTGNRDAPSLGTCPVCETTIPSECLLIEYHLDDGWPRLFAECPACEEPVHPE